MKEKIVELLGAGYAPNVVATALGLDDSYISQIADQHREDIQARRLSKLDSIQQHDNELDDIEEIAIRKMKQLIGFAQKPMEVVRMFEAVNSAKRKSDIGAKPTDAAPATIVNLNFGEAAKVHFKLSSDRQVVEVEGRSMATLPAKVLQEKLKQRQESRPQITDQMTADAILSNLQDPTINRGLDIPSIASSL